MSAGLLLVSDHKFAGENQMSIIRMSLEWRLIRRLEGGALTFY